MKRRLTQGEKLVLQLMQNAPVVDRCPHLAQDASQRPYCSAGLGSEPPSSVSYNVCDLASLQMWCLDPKGHDSCIFYRPK